ncbi:MAG: COX15/CtaA family protein [Tenacibaculum sp.]
MKRYFFVTVKIAIISVYIIFLTGSIVRMTGSGMGCPDWPKCFGYYIPPTSEQQILWKPNTKYKKGSIIVKDKALFVAEKDIKTNRYFKPSNWSKYTKHSYAKFNKYHTWTEYINRLASVLAGFVFLFLIYGSTKFWNTNKTVVIIAYSAFALMLFEAWLGKIVVDTNLKPIVITAHMLGGLLIIALLLYLYFKIAKQPEKKHRYNSLFSRLLLVLLVFITVQIILGTQVRQFIDQQIKFFGFENKKYSLMNPSFVFYFHRSFTIAIVLLSLVVFYLNQIKDLGYGLVSLVVFLIFLETLSGILMYYINFPFGTQAVHLLGGALLFGLQFYLYLQGRRSKMVFK